MPNQSTTLAQLDVIMIHYSFINCDGEPDSTYTWLFDNQASLEDAADQVNYDVETNKNGTNGKVLSISR